MHPHPPPVPLLTVHHLPSASSFYGSLLAPLGVVYLSSTPNPSFTPNAPPHLHFGYLTPSPSGPRPLTVFSLTQATPHQPLRRSHIVLPAESALQVRDVWHKAEILLPGSPGNRIERVEPEGERCMTRDFDGNVIETIYASSDPIPQHTSPKPRRVSRSEQVRGREVEREKSLDLTPPPAMNGDKESRRVLEWQSEVAKSISVEELVAEAAELPIRCHLPRSDVSYRERERDELIGPSTFRRADTLPLERDRGGPGRNERERERLVRRETLTAEHYARPAGSERRSSASGSNVSSGGGITAKGVAGMVLGAAAGVAIAYAMVRSESPSGEETVETVPIARRVYKEGSHYTHVASSPRGIQMEDREAADIMPARSYVSERSGEGRGARDVQPRYVAYNVSFPPQSPSSKAHQQVGAGSSRRNSSHSRPLTILPKEPSVVHSSTSRQSKPRARSPSRSHISRRSGADSPEREPRKVQRSPSREPSNSYTSARTHQSRARSAVSQSASSTASGSTVRAERELIAKVPTPPSAVSERSIHSQGRSHRSSGKSKLYRENEPRERYRDSGERESVYSHSPRSHHSRDHERETPRSRVSNSYERAREVPLPPSMASGFGYAESVAPSDSVSSVGSKRERERLRERMGMRDGRMGHGHEYTHERRGVVGGW